jgi:hypothetical protein
MLNPEPKREIDPFGEDRRHEAIAPRGYVLARHRVDTPPPPADERVVQPLFLPGTDPSER